MKPYKLLQPMLGLLVAAWGLVGCGTPAATPVAEAPPATAIPQSTATPTLKPLTATPTTIPLTATPIDTPEPTATPTNTASPTVTPTNTPEPTVTSTPTPAVFNPQAGASFSGPLTLSEAGSSGTASGGMLDFTITEDGAAITAVTITFMKPVCPSISGVETSSRNIAGLFPISEGKIEAVSSESGNILSPGNLAHPLRRKVR